MTKCFTGHIDQEDHGMTQRSSECDKVVGAGPMGDLDAAPRDILRTQGEERQEQGLDTRNYHMVENGTSVLGDRGESKIENASSQNHPQPSTALSTAPSARDLKLEICCFSSAAAITAAEHGADRIELCSGPVESGGLTADVQDLLRIKHYCKTRGFGIIPVYCMLRPNSGFMATDEEVRDLLTQMDELIAAGADGLVFGFLKRGSQGDAEKCESPQDLPTELDLELLEVLLKRARAQKPGMPCTFHRAFNEISNMTSEEALPLIHRLGFNFILTSGGGGNAPAALCIETLRQLVGLSRCPSEESSDAPSPIEIIVAGGVRCANLPELVSKTGAKWFHSMATVSGTTGISRQEVGGMARVLRMESGAASAQ